MINSYIFLGECVKAFLHFSNSYVKRNLRAFLWNLCQKWKSQLKSSISRAEMLEFQSKMSYILSKLKLKMFGEYLFSKI